MSFFTINQEPVFIPWNKYKKLTNEFTKGKDPLDKIAAYMEGDTSKELSKMFVDYLSKEYDNNPKKFDEQYVNFNLKNEEAKENTWNLIYDYSMLYNYPLLYDARDFSEILSNDYQRKFNEFTYPMGDVFYLKFKIPTVPKRSIFWGHKQDYNETMIKIDCNSVNSIVGSLKGFSITTDKYKLTFYPNLLICE